MLLTEAHLVPLLVGMAVFAVALGLLANLLALRLLLDRGKAANEATFAPRMVAHRSRHRASRAALKLVPARPPARPGLRRPYFPELAYLSARKPLLKRVSQK